MQQKLKNLMIESLKNLGIEGEVSFNIEHPDNFENGDYSTNVAMVCAKQQKINPKELAEKIAAEIRARQDLTQISKVEVAGPGFINFYLSREFFIESINKILEEGENWGRNNILSDKKVMVEYTDPNPFKPFHIGHLMANAIGESISRIIEFSGAKTIRANYQGDVGPHVAKAIYQIMKIGLPDESLSVEKKANYIGKCYSDGSNLYDTDKNIKKEIDEINKKIYDKSDKKINDIYTWGRGITLEAFEEIYELLGTKFDYYFFESEMAPKGEQIVRENVGRVFKESKGAIVFHGEEYDPKLHTRVFINSQGLPTYEAKEIGLTLTKFNKEKDLDLSIVTTAIEQGEYMKVVQKAISLMYPEIEKKMKHITHGMMRFANGKMSSREGNVITGESLLTDVQDKVFWKMMHSNPKHDKTRINEDIEKRDKEVKEICEKVGVSAIKYSILKSSLGSDIIYDFEKSISFEGDSGPYLQYTAVRANSILNKSKSFNLNNKNKIPIEVLELEKKLYQFKEIVEYSYLNLEPHHIATYLTELASAFNSFYGNTQILKDDNVYANYHLDLVKAFYQTMKNGLWLLGIEVPERM